MSLLKKPWARLALCTAVFLLIWVGCTLATLRLIYGNDSLLLAWLNGMSAFHFLGWFEYMSDEDMPDAILNSLACLWFPLAVWVTWRLNRKLKRCQE